MNHIHKTPADSSPDLRAVAGNLFPSFKPADMQFNIGRLEGMPERGLDIVDANGTRHYLTTGSSVESEASVKKQRGLGGAAILRLAKIEDNVMIYDVPNGSKTVAKSFRQAPYKEEYVNRQAFRVGQFVKKLRALDGGMFGIAVQDLAVTYGTPDRENQDDVNLTIVPPLSEAGEAPTVTDEMLEEQTAWFFDGKRLDSFIKGLRGE